jgi:hypothetical protein
MTTQMIESDEEVNPFDGENSIRLLEEGDSDIEQVAINIRRETLRRGIKDAGLLHLETDDIAYGNGYSIPPHVRSLNLFVIIPLEWEGHNERRRPYIKGGPRCQSLCLEKPVFPVHTIIEYPYVCICIMR